LIKGGDQTLDYECCPPIFQSCPYQDQIIKPHYINLCSKIIEYVS